MYQQHAPSSKAAQCGEPSYIWRAGQERRLRMILEFAKGNLPGRVLDDGCGVGTYVDHLKPYATGVAGLEYEFDRAVKSRAYSDQVICGASEHLPYPADSFDLILSNEVIEHVQNDRQAIQEMIRTLKPGGRLILFCPNRGYPFETHGIYWKGKYHFGNIPLVNYLPRKLRNRLAPHVRIYARQDLEVLFQGLPVHFIEKRIIYGAYDNIIARKPAIGRFLRAMLQTIERTPLQFFGLSHFWVVEKDRQAKASAS